MALPCRDIGCIYQPGIPITKRAGAEQAVVTPTRLTNVKKALEIISRKETPSSLTSFFLQSLNRTIRSLCKLDPKSVQVGKAGRCYQGPEMGH